MGGAPTTVTFRGITVDPITADALTELARIVGDDIRLSPIPGFGSYRTNAASGGTDTGGGHADINAEGLTDEQARRIETRARQVGFIAWFRPRVSPYSGRSYGWQRHVHLIRRDCADLSTAARAQIVAYDKGLDGLAVPHKDTGSRAYVGVTWAKYLAAQKAATPARQPQPAPAPPKEPDMQFTDIVPGSKPPTSVGAALLRALTAYPRTIENGWLDRRLDAVESSIGNLRAAIEADDKAQAQAILDRISVELSVKPEPDATPPAA